MPEICRFYGIVIQIYYGDHPPAHFHAVYGEEVAKIAIETFSNNRGNHSAARLGSRSRMGENSQVGAAGRVRAGRSLRATRENCTA